MINHPVLKLMAVLLPVLVFTAPPVFAKNEGSKVPAVKKEDVSALFCPALKDEKTYDGRYDSYRMLVPGDDGWIFRTGNDLQTKFSINDRTISMIASMQKELKKKDVDFIMLYVPTRGMIHSDKIRDEDKKKYGFTDIDQVWSDYKDTIKKMDDAGINVVSIERPAPGEPFFYKRDHHWGQAGAQTAAKAVAAYVKEMPVYKDLTKVAFTSTKKDPYDFFGTTDKVFSKVCNTKQPPERINIITTERTEKATGQDDLFGDATEPEVVLMGTSNSTWEPSFSNFEGFLKEELSADILNMSVSGGGIDTGMISYLNTDHKKQNKAKLVIWEVPGYYDLNKHLGLFRQAMPAIYGDCGAKAITVAKDITIKKDGQVLMKDLSKKNISGPKYYVYLNFSEPVKQAFTIDFRFQKDRDKYKLSRSPRYKPDGEFYFSLKGGKKGSLETLVIEAPKEMAGLKVTAKVCKIP